jgi:hypothetical protein
MATVTTPDCESTAGFSAAQAGPAGADFGRKSVDRALQRVLNE